MAAAMILAAGLGTRLRPLTDELPKPLAWIGDRPMIAHLAERLAAGGVDRAVINTHHLAAAFEGVLGDLPLSLVVVHEPEILGTSGGIANAARELGPGDVVVWNGDILADVDIGALLDTHRRLSAAATLAVAPRPRGEGTLGLGAAGEVVRLRGERFGEEQRGGDFVGVQALGEPLRRRLPIPGCLVGDGYLPALREGALIATFAVPAEWDDIGTLEAYLQANARWLTRSGRSTYVGPGATIAPGIDTTGSVIGASAIIEGSGALHGCVVWPRATAKAPLDRAVVTTRGLVVTKS